MVKFKIFLHDSSICSIDTHTLSSKILPNSSFILKTEDGNEVTIEYGTIKRILAIIKTEKEKHGRK